MPDEGKILDNIVEPDIIVEYFFLEKRDDQITHIDGEQGYQMGFLSLFISGEFKNDNLSDFKKLIHFELDFSVKEYYHFISEKFDFVDYKFALVDNDKQITEYEVMDEDFFTALLASLRNLMIIGKNLDIEKVKRDELFDEWFDTYTNRV